MDDKAQEGIIWAVITGLCGFGAATSSHPRSKLFFSLAAVAAATEAGNCFYNSAQVAYQQLSIPQEYRQLPPHVYYE